MQKLNHKGLAPCDLKTINLSVIRKINSSNYGKPTTGSGYGIEYKGRRIICTYSEKRAKKDAHEREKLIDKV